MCVEECKNKGLQIKFYANGMLGNGLMDITEIKANGETRSFPYQLCQEKDFQQFAQAVRENRRSFLIGEESGMRTFELLVNEEGLVNFRIPEWNAMKEMETRILSIYNKVKFPVAPEKELRASVKEYVDKELNRLFPKNNQLDLKREMLNIGIQDAYFAALYQEDNVQDDFYDFLTLEEWMHKNNMINDVE